MPELYLRRYSAGDRVRLHYARHWRAHVGRHLQEGVVRIAPGPGCGPRNYGVEVDGVLVVVPHGHLRKVTDEAQGRLPFT